ncbi:hypothetical protein HanLR1_Chr04g0151201 [Helianthus annuus]|nr:hypothetical protein HanLR1_Chr04g0151201 [Helianthus annuus]
MGSSWKLNHFLISLFSLCKVVTHAYGRSSTIVRYAERKPVSSCPSFQCFVFKTIEGKYMS